MFNSTSNKIMLVLLVVTFAIAVFGTGVDTAQDTATVVAEKIVNIK